MKRSAKHLLLCCMAIFCMAASAQTKREVFVHIVDANGQPIRGTSTTRLFERQIIATQFSGVTTGSPEVSFSMPVSGASGALAAGYNRKQKLQQAVFSVTERSETGLHVSYTVRMEGVAVVSTVEPGGDTEVKLRADRMGTSYFQYNLKTGVRSVSSKTGFDFCSGQRWNAF